MEDAEAVIERAEGVFVVLKSVGRFRLHDEQGAIGFEQGSNFGQRRLWRGKVVHTIAGGDEIETAVCRQVTRRAGEKRQVWASACRGGERTRAQHGIFVGI